MKQITNICIGVFMCFQFGFSQTQELATSETFNIASPNVSDFIKYGNVESSKYNGTLNMSVPLFSLNDKDFPISAGLAFNATGFMPNKHEGVVGLNWSLNVGGAITREVKGLPDDQTSFPSVNNTEPHGYLVGLRKRGVNNYYPKEDIFQFNPNVGFRWFNPIWIYGQEGDFNSYSEAQPDVFHFNVMGISGKFYIDNEMKAQVQTDIPMKIDISISGLSSQPYNDASCYPRTSTIRMSLDNGYQYVFGGNQTYLEYTFDIVDSTQLNGFIVGSKPSPTINTWFLREVIAPNGKKLEFNYESMKEESDFCKNMDGVDTPEGHRVILNSYFNESRNIREVQIDDTFAGGVKFEDNYTGLTKYNIVKTSYLKEIISEDNYRITFNYSETNDPYQIGEITFGQNLNTNKTKLTSILVSNAFGTVIGDIEDADLNTGVFSKKFDFEYKHKGQYDDGTSSQNRMFLTKVQEAGKEPYIFHYYKDDKLPLKTTKGTDYWGFWNGKDENKTTIPQTIQDRNGDFEYLSKEREPNSYLYDVAMLKRVIYPTKGYSEFIYEPHQYGKRLERRSEYNFFTNLYDDMQISYAGGARIKEIVDISENGETNRRKFVYATKYPELKDKNKSSGILNSWPRYITVLWLESDEVSLTSSKVKNVTFNNYALDGSHITYDEVTEILSNDAMITSNYLSYTSFPDGPISGIGNGDSNLSETTVYLNPRNLHANYIGLKTLDKSMYRGKLKQESYYNSQSKLDSKIEYDYNDFVQDMYFVDIHASGFVVQASKQFYSPVFKTSQKTTNYFQNDSISNTITYDYNYNYKKMIGQTGDNSLGEITRTEYKYPFDLNCTSGIYENIVNDNLASDPVEVVTKVNDKVVNASVFNYYRPANSDYVLMTSNKSLSSGMGLTDYQSVSAGTSCELVTDSRMQQEYQYTRYDQDEGNLLEFSFKNDTPTSLIWGYNGQKLLAKVEGVGYDRMVEILGDPIIDGLINFSKEETSAADEVILQNKLNKMRSVFNAAPENIMATTYIHDMYVGVKAMGDPKGYWTFYEYDLKQRLTDVWDHNNKLVQHYEYNYRTSDIISIIDTDDDYPDPYGLLHYYFKPTGDLIVKAFVLKGSGNYSYSWSSGATGQVGISDGDEYKVTPPFVPCHGSVPPLQMECLITDKLTGEQILVKQSITRACDPNDPDDNTDPDFDPNTIEIQQ